MRFKVAEVPSVLAIIFLVLAAVFIFKKLTSPPSEKSSEMARMSAERGVHVLKNVDFEVFGKVQGKPLSIFHAPC